MTVATLVDTLAMAHGLPASDLGALTAELEHLPAHARARAALEILAELADGARRGTFDDTLANEVRLLQMERESEAHAS